MYRPASVRTPIVTLGFLGSSLRNVRRLFRINDRPDIMRASSLTIIRPVTLPSQEVNVATLINLFMFI